MRSKNIVISNVLNHDEQNVDGKDGIHTEGDWSDTTIANRRKDGADKVH